MRICHLWTACTVAIVGLSLCRCVCTAVGNRSPDFPAAQCSTAQGWRPKEEREEDDGILETSSHRGLHYPAPVFCESSEHSKSTTRDRPRVNGKHFFEHRSITRILLNRTTTFNSFRSSDLAILEWWRATIHTISYSLIFCFFGGIFTGLFFSYTMAGV